MISRTVLLLTLMACASTATTATCGNGTLDENEVCDGTLATTCQDHGFVRGNLRCLDDCSGIDTSGCEVAVDADPICGNGLLEDGEECDTTVPHDMDCERLGFDSGELSCDVDCTLDRSGCVGESTCVSHASHQCVGLSEVYWFDSCGLREDLKEACSGGETCVDTSATTAECTLPPATCGDDHADPGEDCDGSDLGSDTCTSLGFDSGSLACSTACTFDTTACCSNNSSTGCIGNDVYWFDSCGNPGSLDDACSVGEACVAVSASSAACQSTCGDGVVDPGEDCDGGVPSGNTCDTLGYDQGTLACSSVCTWDTSACETCSIEPDPPLFTWTPSFTPNTSCTCSVSDPYCHTLYECQVQSIVGNNATIACEKTTGGGPSATVDYWIAVLADLHPTCLDLNSYVTRTSGSWPVGTTPLVVANVDIWPSWTDYDAAPAGEFKRIALITGDGAAPSVKTWYSEQSLTFTKVCAP